MEEVWREYAGPLKGFVARRVGNAHDAEDVLQEVFLRAHVGLGGVRNPGLLKPWLYRIAENAVYDHHRRRRARTAEAGSYGADHEPREPVEEWRQPENVNAGVITCLRAMIEELPEGYRRALVMADLEGQTQRRVAEELGLSVPGAKSRVQRARRRLEVALRACCSLELDRVGNVLSCNRREPGDCRC